MQLFWTPASPFTRKVCIVARELKLWERIDVLPTTWTLDWGYTTPVFTPGLAEANPVARIPTLISDDGVPLGDSTVICLHLASLGCHEKLIPADAQLATHMWSRYAVADGIIEAQIAMRAELLRPHTQRSDSFLQKQRERITRCLDTLERDAPSTHAPFDLGAITTAVALGYQDWRDWLFDFRPRCPRLAEWFDVVKDRDSMRATEPQETPTG